jgi:hypothetical protein
VELAVRSRAEREFDAAGPAYAGGRPQLTATEVRIGDHPAFVRVVVDFNGTVRAKDVEFRALTKTMATLRLNHPGVATGTSGRTRDGVSAALQPATQGLNIAMTYAPRRFKYLSYAVVTGNRLAMDLWKSAPPTTPTQTCKGLSIGSRHVKPGVVTVIGTEHGIFENQFAVVLRSTGGKVLGRKHVYGPGSWSASVRYRAVRHRTGTLEAVAFSPKDGALECLAQVRVSLIRIIPRGR